MYNYFQILLQLYYRHFQLTYFLNTDQGLKHSVIAPTFRKRQVCMCPDKVQKVPAARTSFLRLHRLPCLPCGKMERRCTQTLAKASSTLQSHPHFAKRKCACALTKSKGSWSTHLFPPSSSLAMSAPKLPWKHRSEQREKWRKRKNIT